MVEGGEGGVRVMILREGEQERERTDMCADGHRPRVLWGTEEG